jgi:Na+-transporting NADH:ubiquinone oxidoreductase subunit NqrC
VVKGEAVVLCPDSIDYCVDGVSGATITSRGVDIMVEDALAFYDPYLTRIRGR